MQKGFTYLSLLFFVAVLGIGLSATAVSWQHAAQREKERELLFIGEEFREAIALYYYRTPGAIKEYPRELSDLTRDPRYPSTQRYLRRIYRDPMKNDTSWGKVLDSDGRIMGVYSLSNETPIKKSGFIDVQEYFEKAGTYSDWRFVFAPQAVTSPKAPNPTN